MIFYYLTLSKTNAIIFFINQTRDCDFMEKEKKNENIKYYKLFDLLNRKGLKKKDLLSVLSPATVTKLSKHGIVTTDTIGRLCEFLDCQPGDLIEYESSKKEEIKKG